MKKWSTDKAEIEMVEFDYNLMRFAVENKDSELLGYVTPADTDMMDEILAELDNGGCPIADGWEDGAGNTCTSEGW